MTIQQIRYILGVADSPSFNKAAERLFVSQPSLSAAVRDAETELGFSLFTRTARGVSPTERGSRFIADAREFYAHYESLIKKHTADGRKSFAVSALYYPFARKAFVEIVRSFSGEGCEFAFREKKFSDVIADVADGRSDVGLLYLSGANRDSITASLRSSGLSFRHLTDCGAFAYLHKSHPLAKKETVSLGELSAFRFVTFDTDDLKSFFSEDAIARFGLGNAITVADRATELNLIKSLNGYTFLSGVPGEETNEDFVLIPLETPEDGPSHRFELGYITMNGVRPNEICLAYMDAVRRILHIAGFAC